MIKIESKYEFLTKDILRDLCHFNGSERAFTLIYSSLEQILLVELSNRATSSRSYTAYSLDFRYPKHVIYSFMTKKLNPTNVFWITLIHIMAVVATFYFSWTGLALSLFGLFVAAPIGINMGYHRLLAHKAFVTPIWMRNTLITIGTFLGAGPPLQWAAAHRKHHKYSDQDQDPHNSRLGFWHSHMMHLMYASEVGSDSEDWKKYIPDLINDPYLKFLDKYSVQIAVLEVPLLYAWGGFQFVLWGAFFRLAISLHVMWFVNSASHMWGYRSHKTTDNTRNNWWVGILAAGEGWHNNHHACANSARHGVRWWELDFTYLLILCLKWAGLATHVKGFIAPKTSGSLSSTDLSRLSTQDQTSAPKFL